jgi:hypothetical protein
MGTCSSVDRFLGEPVQKCGFSCSSPSSPPLFISSPGFSALITGREILQERVFAKIVYSIESSFFNL